MKIELPFFFLFCKKDLWHVLLDGGLNSFGVGTVDNLHLFPADKVMKGGNRSDPFPLHELGCIWRGITDNLYTRKKCHEFKVKILICEREQNQIELKNIVMSTKEIFPS